jgi:hypothetical protein
MPEPRLAETMRVLQGVRDRTREVAVAFSGGKDSLVVMEMATRMFDRVVPFFLYLVPGLECVEQELGIAKTRWGLEVLHLPHYGLGDIIRNGMYCPNTIRQDDLQTFSFADACSLACHKAGVPVALTGMKRADSTRRAMILKQNKSEEWAHPLIGWNRYDVIGYLKQAGIPYDADSSVLHGMTTAALLRMYDKWPRDFAKMAEVFPYLPAVVWRRTFYGVEPAKRNKA